MTHRRTILLDSAVLLLLAFFLIKPLFRLKYLDNWPSIESTYIAEGRMIGEHLPHPGWQPLWYLGTRTDYIYPPAPNYGVALISRFGHVLPARAYHLYTALFYVFGIIAVYGLVRIGSASRGSALLASVATALISPSFLFLTDIRHDSGYWVPQRLHVLMVYGEGPHISSLSVLGAALAASFLALRKWRPAALAAAGALCALVAATNLYGATALAFFYPIAVWSVWVGERHWAVWLRAACIPLVAYGFSAFWFTPSYLWITLVNRKWQSPPGDTASLIVMSAALAIYCLFSFGAASRTPEREWSVFVAGAAVVLSVYVLGFAYFGLRLTGDPPRLVPELDLAIVLVGVEMVRTLWKRPRLRLAAALVTAIALLPGVRYIRHAWSLFPTAPPLENVYEYKIAAWVHDHLPGQRVLPSGTVRFWFDVWSDNSQPDGGSTWGILNQIVPVATWQIEYGDQANIAVLWLKALGTDAAIVPDKTSFEAYHDYQKPEKFRGLLPVLYDDGHGTVIYKIARAPGIARIVDRARFDRIGKIHGGDDWATLTNYISVVDDPAQNPATLTWKGFDEAEVEGKTQQGQSVLLEETWDPAWHAFENGRELPIRAGNTIAFMVIDAPPGDHRIQMRFLTPLENRVGQFVFFVTALVMAGLITMRFTVR
ncbi:MAG TPA: hypothetical protein VHY84_02455 [Bryobacteraceae bacterium]|jgi:hypothetical protein|nr:hypothetical protein [Bryobacteraceae bacterium]